MEMTSTHGIILAAIGLAVFAILTVVWVLRRAQSVRAAIRNFRIVQEPPAPYAPIAGTGSRPVNPLEERVAELEHHMAGVREWIAHEAAQAFNDARLEAGGEGDGWRAFKAADWTWVWTGEELHVRYKPCPWTPSGYSLPAELYEQVAGVTELHGPERARIVRAFLEWKGGA